MAWFKSSKDVTQTTQTAKSDSTPSSRLRRELENILRLYDKEFSNMTSIKKLEVLTLLKRRNDDSKLFPVSVGEIDVPIKTVYQYIYSLLFNPQENSSLSYFNLLNDSISNAKVSYNDILAQEQFLLKKLSDEKILMNYASNHNDDVVQKVMSVMNTSKARRNFLYAAIKSLELSLSTVNESTPQSNIVVPYDNDAKNMEVNLKKNGYVRFPGSAPFYINNDIFIKKFSNGNISILQRICKTNFFVEAVGTAELSVKLDAKARALKLKDMTYDQLKTMDANSDFIVEPEEFGK